MNVVARVKEAFETEEVVRLDCTHVGTSDCKKIGLKLKVCRLILNLFVKFMRLFGGSCEFLLQAYIIVVFII